MARRSLPFTLVAVLLIRAIAAAQAHAPVVTMSVGCAARKLDQYAARKVSHLRGRYSTPIDHH
jgi:hypothetical protein